MATLSASVALTPALLECCDRRPKHAPCARNDDKDDNRCVDYDWQEETADEFGVAVNRVRRVRQRPVRNDPALKGPADRSVGPFVNLDEDGGGDSQEASKEKERSGAPTPSGAACKEDRCRAQNRANNSPCRVPEGRDPGVPADSQPIGVCP